jgi:hypothetical protein
MTERGPYEFTSFATKAPNAAYASSSDGKFALAW